MPNDGQKMAGCLCGLLSLAILLPMSIGLWFGTLTAIEAPTWMWVLFWVYAPAVIILSVLRVIVDEVLKD